MYYTTKDSFFLKHFDSFSSVFPYWRLFAALLKSVGQRGVSKFSEKIRDLFLKLKKNTMLPHNAKKIMYYIYEHFYLLLFKAKKFYNDFKDT